MLKKILFTLMVLIALSFLRCGEGVPSYTERSATFSTPTGALTEDNVASVAEEFSDMLGEQDYYYPDYSSMETASDTASAIPGILKIIKQVSDDPYDTYAYDDSVTMSDSSSSGSSGSGDVPLSGCTYDYSDSTVTVTCACDVSGNFLVEVSSDTTSTTSTYEFNDCTFTSNLSIDGTGYLIYDSGFTSFIYYFKGSAIVNGEKQSGEYEIYYDATTAEYWYLVLLNGNYYSISGTFDGTDGTFTIKDANSTWTCAAVSSSGSCTDGTDTITW